METKTKYDCGHYGFEYTPIFHESETGNEILVGRACIECGNDAEKNNALRIEFTKTMRKRYIDGEISHSDYYRSLYKSLCISMEGHDILPKAKKALDEGDKYLNTIDLNAWDAMGFYIAGKRTAHDVFKLYGDVMTISGLVCAYKQAVKDAIA